MLRKDNSRVWKFRWLAIPICLALLYVTGPTSESSLHNLFNGYLGFVLLAMDLTIYGILIMYGIYWEDMIRSRRRERKQMMGENL